MDRAKASPNKSLARVIGGEDGFLERGRFTPNRPHVVAEGLAVLGKALTLNEQGASERKGIIQPFDV